MADDKNGPKLRPGDPGYIGRGHPPRQHQFKKGQSGNPRGRPKGRHSFEERMARALEEPIMSTDGRLISPDELVRQAVLGNLGRGNLKAVPLYLELREKYCKSHEDDYDLDEARRERLAKALVRMKGAGEGSGEDFEQGSSPSAQVEKTSPPSHKKEVDDNDWTEDEQDDDWTEEEE